MPGGAGEAAPHHLERRHLQPLCAYPIPILCCSCCSKSSMQIASDAYYMSIDPSSGGEQHAGLQPPAFQDPHPQWCQRRRQAFQADASPGTPGLRQDHPPQGACREAQRQSQGHRRNRVQWCEAE